MKLVAIGQHRIWRELARWPRLRWSIAGGIALALTVALGLSTGVLPVQPRVPGNLPEVILWWVYPLVGVGSIGSGLLIASYFWAPTGAKATFCDLRWPMFALMGIAMATGSRASGATFADVLDGPAGSLGEIARIVVGIAALLLIVWSLSSRLARERLAQDAADRGGSFPACTDCRPLFR
jgi:hypothetical protein